MVYLDLVNDQVQFEVSCKAFGGTICSYHVRPFGGNPKLYIRPHKTLLARSLALGSSQRSSWFVVTQRRKPWQFLATRDNNIELSVYSTFGPVIGVSRREVQL